MRSLRWISKSSVAITSALVLGIAGCSGDPLTGPKSAIEGGKSKWEKQALDDYSFRYRRVCFCGYDETRPVIVFVRKDTVADVLFADTRQPVPRERLPSFPTIDGIFGVLQDAVEKRAHEITATYDETLGYPSTAWIDYVSDIADEEIRITVDSVRVIQ